MPTLPAPAHLPRRRALLSLSAALLLPLLTACATGAAARPSPVEMSIVDRDSGQVLPVYRKDGRSYVAGRPAARYAIRLANQSAGRVLVVLSVDGINVVSGQTAGYHQTGYVLEPWRSHDIAGWRKSDAAIAAFEFAALRDSYAARTGRPGQVGVIGMAVFLEKPAPVELPLAAPMPEQGRAAPAAADRLRSDEGADRAAGSAARSMRPEPAPAEKLGTAHGQREWSVATRTEFERLSATPQAVVEISYDSIANLVAAGIIRVPLAQARPRPFPLDDDGYVPDPPLR
jgi:hypothetical protein